MSTWTDEKHEATRELVRVVGDAHLVSSSLRTVVGTLGEALDEIKRLRALATITDDKVERVVAALSAHSTVVHPRRDPRLTVCEACGREVDQVAHHAARMALEATLTPKENQS